VPPTERGFDGPYPGRPGSLFSFSNAFELGWMTFKARYGLLLAAAAISTGAGLAHFVIVRIARGIGGDALGSVVSFCAGVLLSGPLAVGLYWTGVAAVRGRLADVEALFAGFRRYWTCVVVYLLLALIAFGVMLPVLCVIWGGVALGAGFGRGSGVGVAGVLALLLIIPCALVEVLVAVRLSMSVLLIVDERAGLPGAVDALKLSWQLTRPVQWPAIGLVVVVSLINAVGTAFLFLPMVFFTLPLSVAVFGAAYQQILAQSGLLREIGKCHVCGYDLSGFGGRVCPECGAALGGGGRG
jgi:hypothetical protein